MHDLLWWNDGPALFVVECCGHDVEGFLVCHEDVMACAWVREPKVFAKPSCCFPSFGKVVSGHVGVSVCLYKAVDAVVSPWEWHGVCCFDKLFQA